MLREYITIYKRKANLPSLRERGSGKGKIMLPNYFLAGHFPTMISSLFFATMAFPIPFTAVKSSAFLKHWFFRYSTIALALAAPIPLSVVNFRQ